MSVISRIFPAIFACIGIMFIRFLWSDNDFGGPPVEFKVIGTLISSVFVLMGISGVITGGVASKQSPNQNGPARSRSTGEAQDGERGYACTNCGASLSAKAEVSPSGDVKCSYCERWFNIHNPA